MLKSHIGEIAALGTAFCWTFTGISFEYAGKKVGSLAVNFIRLILGFIFISIFTYLTRGLLLPTDSTSFNWIWLGLSGIIGFFIGDLFLFQAYLEVGTRVAMLIMAASPPITALLGFIFMGEVITSKGLLGMAITTLGIAVVILSKEPGEKKIKTTHSIKGLTYAFLGAVGQSVGLVLSKVGMGTYNAFAATQIRIITGFIGFFILFMYKRNWKDLTVALKDKKAMTGITIGSIFGPFLGVSLALISLQNTTAGISATITSIMPVLIIPFSIILFKEKVKPKEILGTLISVVGVAILFIA
jgi:drug/metabolite transporter (DMT)-like permease